AIPVALEVALDRLLDAVGGHLAPPADDNRWLRTPGARVALRRAALAALAHTAEHTPPAHLRLFDRFFLMQPETSEVLAGLLLPAARRTPAQVSAALVDGWQQQFADPSTVDRVALAAVVDDFIPAFTRELRA